MVRNEKQPFLFWDSFFYFLGFSSNPFLKDTIDILKTDPSEAVKKDLLKIKKDYKNSYKKVAKDLLIES